MNKKEPKNEIATEPEAVEATKKKDYKKPGLSEYGTLTSITKGAGSMGFEFFGFMNAMM